MNNYRVVMLSVLLFLSFSFLAHRGHFFRLITSEKFGIDVYVQGFAETSACVVRVFWLLWATVATLLSQAMMPGEKKKILINSGFFHFAEILT